MTPAHPASDTRRGSVLLEVLLALVLFIGAAMATMSLTDRVLEGSRRIDLSRQAADLAASAMAKLEAGLATPETLSGPVRAESTSSSQPTDTGWLLDIQTEPSRFTDLTHVTVRAILPRASDPESPQAEFELHQLVRLTRTQPEPIHPDPLSPAEGTP